MHSHIAAHLRFRGELLLAGRIEALLDYYAFPLPIFLPAERLLLSGRPEARLFLSLLRQRLLRDGVAALRPEVRAVELPRAGRFRVWADWNELTLAGEAGRSSSAVYFCRATALGPQVEMVNYTRASMPDLAQQFEALALSA
ncbi:hypothetical protein [Rhodobacter calidifons]|uniref:Uncharacterized protein n=1 Tax=Rhodobacter calidifons TaxID=2715277 RepID=A0ABX0G520_9RHOB|nr:hypothetical protein [Rhodobacter calidifons]NHB76295.1 hypothetical protein [Rhodobacter calidifons]